MDTQSRASNVVISPCNICRLGELARESYATLALELLEELPLKLAWRLCRAAAAFPSSTAIFDTQWTKKISRCGFSIHANFIDPTWAQKFLDHTFVYFLFGKRFCEYSGSRKRKPRWLLKLHRFSHLEGPFSLVLQLMISKQLVPGETHKITKNHEWYSKLSQWRGSLHVFQL